MEFIDDGLLLGERCKVTSNQHMDLVLSKFVRDKTCGEKDVFTGYVNALTGDLISGKRLYVETREVYEGPFQNGSRHGPGAVCTKLDGNGKFLGR